MDEHSNSQVDVVDDEFERLGRLAGAELRQPAPADGAGTVLRSAHRRRATVATVAAGITVAVVVAGLIVATSRTQNEPAPIATAPPNPIPEVSTTAPFVGTWLSTDTDGSSQTMQIVGSGGDNYEVVVRDDFATTCSGAAAMMTGTGLLETDQRLVITQPELTCDDGTTPSIGPPPQADIADFTFDRDPVADELTDRFGVVWQRAGSIVDLDEQATSPPTSGGMWPQSTLDEVRAAQELADAGDPDFEWQVEPQLNLYETRTIEELGDVELVDRFLREVLGWEAYLFDPHRGGVPDGLTDGALRDQFYYRCAPGRTNPLYPPRTGSEQPGDSCGPTIDDLNYESVSLDLAQLDRQGRDGIWVVNRWRPIAFAQADPEVVEAQGKERLEEFLSARIAGEGAEGNVQVDANGGVPLLYAATSGAPYERYEIERVGAPLWPDARMTFSARLFANGDATVVEQRFMWQHSGPLRLENRTTTENGQPIIVSSTSSDGEVTVSAPSTWQAYWPTDDGVNQEVAPDVWFGMLWRDGPSPVDDGHNIGFVDPVAYDAWCAANGGSPLLSAPADAATIAQQLIADPDFDTTAPVTARIGGLEAVSVDVALAPGGRTCGVGMIDISRWIHSLKPGSSRLRLFLVDLPEGMSVETLAITVVAPEGDFDEFIEETKLIIESIEFRPG